MVAGTVPGMNPTPEPISPAAPAARVLSARTPEDIAAFVPLALGFVPERSAVMISAGPRAMHARIDLPHDPDDVDDVVEALLRPARRNLVTKVVFVVYDDDTTVADEASWALKEAFEGAGIAVVDALRVHDDHWYAVLPGRPLAAYNGVRFQRSDHRFTAEGVLDGRVTHRSREALRATIAPDREASTALARRLRSATAVPPGGLRALVQDHLAARTTFTDDELASVAVAVTSGPRRDEVWAWLDREDGRGSVDLWSDAVRRLPDLHVASAAAVLAFAAWLAGDGALAWCAGDRSRDAEPDHSLAGLVAGLLDSATSPATWVTLRPQLGGASDPAA